MTHHPATTDDAFPISSPFQGVDDREIHNEIATADLFYDSAHTAPAKNFSKPLPSSKSDCTDSPPDKIARLMDEAPPGELGGAEECETCLSCKKAKRAAESWTELDEFTCACENVRGGSGGRVELDDKQWSLASPRGMIGAKGFGMRSGSLDGMGDIWTGAAKH